MGEHQPRTYCTRIIFKSDVELLQKLKSITLEAITKITQYTLEPTWQQEYYRLHKATNGGDIEIIDTN
jgi:hypothetical protein